MSTVDKIVQFLTAAPPPAGEVVTLPREVAERLAGTAEVHHGAFADVQAIRAALAEPKAELWAVHSVGPGEVWPALSRERAEQEAKDLRDSMKANVGIEVQVDVIPSPWTPQEHFELLAEETTEHRDDCLDAYREKEAAFKAACADLAAIQALLGLDGAYAGVDPLLRAITELGLKARGEAWLPPETAPQDGSVILADTGYPWPVLAVWSEYAENWVTTELQASVCDDLNDPAWVTESEIKLRGWMVLPATRAVEGVE